MLHRRRGPRRDSNLATCVTRYLSYNSPSERDKVRAENSGVHRRWRFTSIRVQRIQTRADAAASSATSIGLDFQSAMHPKDNFECATDALRGQHQPSDSSPVSSSFLSNHFVPLRERSHYCNLLIFWFIYNIFEVDASMCISEARYIKRQARAIKCESRLRNLTHVAGVKSRLAIFQFGRNFDEWTPAI